MTLKTKMLDSSVVDTDVSIVNPFEDMLATAVIVK